jgi:hypothetical protein
MADQVQTKHLVEIIEYIIEKYSMGVEPDEIAKEISEETDPAKISEMMIVKELEAIYNSRISRCVEELENAYADEYADKLAEIEIRNKAKIENKKKKLLEKTTNQVEDLISSYLDDPENEDYHNYQVPELVSHAKSQVFKKLMEEKNFQRSFLIEFKEDIKKNFDSVTNQNKDNAFYMKIQSDLISELKKDNVLIKKLSGELISDISKSMFSKDK